MRKIITIDEDKCDGCGLCAQACHEGAIIMENGKAKLVSDSYCDGLGDCIGECPRGAISFEMREAAPYDEAAVKARMAAKKAAEGHDGPLPCGCPGSMAKELKKTAPAAHAEKAAGAHDGPLPCGCSGSMVQELKGAAPAAHAEKTGCCSAQESELINWPVQLRLVPTEAPYLKDAHLLIAADCTAFAYPGFHPDLLPGKICLVGCPKLDETEPYIQKLSEIITKNGIRKVDVAYMEVPCCGGLVRLVEDAVTRSGASVTLKLIKLSLNGKKLETREIFS
ncbi:4Fe-4S binding protein [Synergistaceae bacterium OttesenSCG-928-D05]|nr:4Fe-4S binding protein [Synergistaceae bacterium OttesenSCG-928-D05]